PPTDIPVGLPSDLLARRPDLMKSWYELQAAAAKVGIARSNRFPSIALTTDGGLIGSTVKELFTSGYWSWGAAAQLAQPIFSFDRLKRKEQIARVEYEDAVLEYEKSVLTALKEVESSLVGISTYKSQAKQYAEYVDANKRIAELTMALYRNGMNNYLDVISTQQTWYNSQMQLIGLISEQYINYANLVMALGGGWQERD
ncbi:MAG: TolC family protein, partial [Alistipes sp.]|nr:TolC family protein [Alistipes sp.]